MRARDLMLLASAAGLGFGCSKATTPIPPSVLNRSGDVQLVCYDMAAADDASLVLPVGCCRGDTPLLSSSAACPAGAETPTLHALISQTGRGEVAAVDLTNTAVVDSNKQIPGYTFIDVGGLPRAMVVPGSAPFGDGSEGAAWVFVASAEELSVRAVATCRFFRGEACGAELERSDAALAALTNVPLPGVPADMVSSADGTALWVSLPDQGLLARIALSSDPSQPFATAPGQAVPQDPTYFRVPVGRVQAPLEPAPETGRYEALCGLGYEPVDVPIVTPNAPRIALEPGRPAEPAKLVLDAATGLLFVADRSAPLLRAFREADGAIALAGEWGTGQPVIDLALTAEVPAQAPDIAALVAGQDVAQALTGPSVRYAYAVDAVGTVQAYGFAGGAEAPTLSAILPPDPSSRYGDRLPTSGHTVAISVIDSRQREPHLCGSDEISGFDRNSSALTSLTSRVDTLAAALSDATSAADSARVASLTSELTALQLELSIANNAGPTSLRGVFLAAVSSIGTVDFLDIFDLDLACRAHFACSADAPYTALSTESGAYADSLAVRRHAQRMSNAGDLSVSVSGDTGLAAIDCPDGYARVFPSSGSAKVCAPQDPWLATNQTWTVAYDAAIPRLAASAGMLEQDDDGALWLRTPSDFSWCERGIAVGDAVHVLTNPAAGTDALCPHPVSEGALRLEVLEAREDRVRVQAVDENVLAPDQLVACFPEFVGFQVHTLGKFLVLSSSGLFLHRTIADATGACVQDEQRDERLESRITPPSETSASALYQSPYLAFALSYAKDPATVAVTMRVEGQGYRVQRNIVDVSTSGRTDVLPVRLRYFPESPDLFVVDSASQGLRRYGLQAPNALTQRTAFR
jgi:hypothetical protein